MNIVQAINLIMHVHVHTQLQQFLIVTAFTICSPIPPTDGSDYITSTLTFIFPNPSAADTMQCGSVPIMDDTNVEPCEAFYLNLTSSAERNRIVDDDQPNTVIIYDDEGTVYTLNFSIFWAIKIKKERLIFAIHVYLSYTFLADVDELLLFNQSPQIVGRSITVDYTISGCAQVLCQVVSRTAEFDCEYNYTCL